MTHSQVSSSTFAGRLLPIKIIAWPSGAGKESQSSSNSAQLSSAQSSPVHTFILACLMIFRNKWLSQVCGPPAAARWLWPGKKKNWLAAS